MEILYGSVEYYTLLNLRDRLKNPEYRKLDLITLDALRQEIDKKIKVINEEFRARYEGNPNCKGCINLSLTFKGCKLDTEEDSPCFHYDHYMIGGQ